MIREETFHPAHPIVQSIAEQAALPPSRVHVRISDDIIDIDNY
jgi:hypothetical protein